MGVCVGSWVVTLLWRFVIQVFMKRWPCRYVWEFVNSQISTIDSHTPIRSANSYSSLTWSDPVALPIWGLTPDSWLVEPGVIKCHFGIKKSLRFILSWKGCVWVMKILLSQNFSNKHTVCEIFFFFLYPSFTALRAPVRILYPFIWLWKMTQHAECIQYILAGSHAKAVILLNHSKWHCTACVADYMAVE